MVLTSDERLDQLVELLERLRTHIASAEAGHQSARDDMAVVLHQLIGEGDGYGLLAECLPILGEGAVEFPIWNEALPDQVAAPDDSSVKRPVVFVLRSTADHAIRGDHAPTMGDLSTFMSEPCLFLSSPTSVAQEISWAHLVKFTRNKFGSHSDNAPPAWLRAIRYYPAADADAVSYLLWALSRVILTGSTAALAGTGMIERYAPTDNYFIGVDLRIAIVGYDGKTLDCTANLGCEKWAIGHKRAIVGGVFEDRPFIFGLDGDGRLAFIHGPTGLPLRSLYRHEWKSGA